MRTTAPELVALLREGVRQSEAFQARVARLETSDLVVYIDYDYSPKDRIAGFVSFIGANGGWRYIQIRIRWDLPRGYRLAILGHELQHAVEIADAPAVVDRASLAALYVRIGSDHGGGTCRSFETRAALEAEDQVAREIRASQNLHPRHEVVRGTSSAGVIQ